MHAKTTTAQRVHAPGCGQPYAWSVPPEYGLAVCRCPDVDLPGPEASKATGPQPAHGDEPLWESPKRDGTPRFQPGAQSAGLAGRVLLGQRIKEGVEPPEELEPDVLLTGKLTQVFSGAGMGKTMLLLWFIKRAIERGELAVLFDMENGWRTISERLAEMDVDTARLDELLYYFPSRKLTLSAEDSDAYVALLDEIEPDLVLFDSWADFLAACGLDENSNTDIARWSVAYAHPARNRGITVVILDHVPHDHSRSRGASRKRDEVDVQWRLTNPKPFDRDTVGEVVLVREKDREGWLPQFVKFSVGGRDGGIVFERSDGTVEAPDDAGLTPSMREALNILGAVLAENGATWAEWWRATGMARSTFGLARKSLETRGFVRRDDQGRYSPTLNPQSSPTGPARPQLDQSGPEEEESNRSNNPVGVRPVGPSPVGAGPSRRHPTAEEVQAVQRLISEGMCPELARAEVLNGGKREL